jgi:tRNA pseudouridine38-40 synthase
VVHFDCPRPRPPRGLVLGGNVHLPPAVSLLWAVPVQPDFHARFDALARRYEYRILNRSARSALRRNVCAWIHQPLDADLMHQAAQQLVGTHDFSALRTVHCQSKQPIKTLDWIEVRRSGDEVILRVQASGFLHHMVRNIVGSLLLIGRGEQPPAWLAEVLASRDRTLAGMTAPAGGLCFLGPLYPASSGLPAEASLTTAQQAALQGRQ